LGISAVVHITWVTRLRGWQTMTIRSKALSTHRPPQQCRCSLGASPNSQAGTLNGSAPWCLTRRLLRTPGSGTYTMEIRLPGGPMLSTISDHFYWYCLSLKTACCFIPAPPKSGTAGVCGSQDRWTRGTDLSATFSSGTAYFCVGFSLSWETVVRICIPWFTPLF
jgi:hypothetical protein